jgi:hypothetical protein
MGIESETGARAIVEPRDDVRPPLRELSNLGRETHASEFRREKRRSFGFAPGRTLGIDRDEPLE